MSTHKVATDALATLGTILTEPQKRDAIHLAVIPARAGTMLNAGTHVGIEDGEATPSAKKLLGIVDPFLTRPVERGESFWMVIYPRVITSLRHVWTHPDIAEEPEKVDHTAADAERQKVYAEVWLRCYCVKLDFVSYENLVAAVRDGKCVLDVEYDDGWEYSITWDGDYIHFKGCDACGSIPAEFWVHMETVLGKKIPRSQETYFSCSC